MAITNEQKDRVWQAYRDRKPIRVPVALGTNPRVVLFEAKWNTRGVTFAEYFRDAAATIEIQLLFMRYQREYANQYCDSPTGPAGEWEFYVDNQNTYDSQYFGAPLEFRDGQVADVPQILAGANKERIFRVDIDHPLDNPFIKDLLRRYEALKVRVETLPSKGIAYKVRLPLLGFDGPLTIAANLRGPEIFTDIYEDREYFLKLLEFLMRGAAIRNRALGALFDRNAFEGPRGGFADDSIALISSAMYRELILPLHRRWYANYGPGPHGIHLCGDATRHFKTIHAELNVDSFDTGFPVDHGWLRGELGEDVEVCGGPEVGLLLGGTPQQVYDRAKGILQSGIMRGGRFVLREANNLPPRVPEKNLEAMYRACLEHGNYAS